MKILGRRFTSVRTTIVLFHLVGGLLLLNVLIPREKYVGESASALARSPVGSFVLETLGLGNVTTSPVFLFVIFVFFMHLTLVLIGRTGVTLRRTRLRPPAEERLRKWCEKETSIHGSGSVDFDERTVLAVLRGLGFPAVSAGQSTVWAVKHRFAPFGFLIFHLSFYLLCLGGVGIYYTRFVGTSALVEGQPFAGFSQVLRSSPLLGPPDLRFSAHDIDPRFVNGLALYLSAVLRFEDGGRLQDRPARINHPARNGSSTILVNRAGIAPVLWLQDEEGFTLDRVAVAAETLRGEPTAAALAGGSLVVQVTPIIDSGRFPDRAALASIKTRLEVRDAEGTILFEGTVSPGRPVHLDGRFLVVQDLRFWVGVYVVREYGGGLLIAGFLIGTIGLVWRLMLYRREVAVSWEGTRFSVAGKAEYFSNRFRRELATLRELLEDT